MPLGDESVPTAMGLVFDTSLSMGYKEKDKTRLDEAKERAREILDKLPDSSQVFVVDSSEPGCRPGLSPAAAPKRIDELTIHPVNRPLNAAMGAGLSGGRRVRPAAARGRYVLTDLAASSWNPDQPAEGLDQVEKVEDGNRRQDRDVRPPAGLATEIGTTSRSTRPSRPRAS